jgi:hypothetical protein
MTYPGFSGTAWGTLRLLSAGRGRLGAWLTRHPRTVTPVAASSLPKPRQVRPPRGRRKTGRRPLWSDPPRRPLTRPYRSRDRMDVRPARQVTRRPAPRSPPCRAGRPPGLGRGCPPPGSPSQRPWAHRNHRGSARPGVHRATRTRVPTSARDTRVAQPARADPPAPLVRRREAGRPGRSGVHAGPRSWPRSSRPAYWAGPPAPSWTAPWSGRAPW